jgi:hypothetical protein
MLDPASKITHQGEKIGVLRRVVVVILGKRGLPEQTGYGDHVTSSVLLLRWSLLIISIGLGQTKRNSPECKAFPNPNNAHKPAHDYKKPYNTLASWNARRNVSGKKGKLTTQDKRS